MLKTALIAMTIMGCDCDARDCYFVSDARGNWSSLAECNGSIETVVAEQHTDSYPLMTATCTERDVAVSAPAAMPDRTLPAPSRPARSPADPNLLMASYEWTRLMAGRATGGTLTAARDTVSWIGGNAGRLVW